MARSQQLPSFLRPFMDLGTGRLPASTVLNQGRYVILSTIGKGGMGAVYLAHDTIVSRAVAVKEMSQARLKPQDLQLARQNFQQEADMLSNLRQENLPQVYASFQENERSYLVMEYIQGQNLLEMLKQGGGALLPTADVIDYGMQLCNVLEYLHTHVPPIIFHDLKPSNVMVRQDGRLFLVDFGIARFFHRNRHDQTTPSFHTPGYSSPEQRAGKSTPQSDLFSLGATLHHCLTGQNPQSHTEKDVFTFPSILKFNPQVPVTLDDLVQDMLSIQAADRPADAGEVRQRLQALYVPPGAQLVIRSADASSPSAPTVGVGASSVVSQPVGGRQDQFGHWLSVLGMVLLAIGAAPFNGLINVRRPGPGKNGWRALEAFWQQQASQILRLRENGHVWERPFTFCWFALLALALGGSVYLQNNASNVPRLSGLFLIMLLIGSAGFYLTEKRLTDPVPRNILAIIAAALCLAGLALQAQSNIAALLATTLQTVTLNQVAVVTLCVGGLVCLVRPQERLLWVDQLVLGLLAAYCALLQYGSGASALATLFPGLSPDLKQGLPPLLVGVPAILALPALFGLVKPLQGGFRFSLFLVAVLFVPIQYALGFQELRSVLAAHDQSVQSAQLLVILSFAWLCIPGISAGLAWLVRRPWLIRVALAASALVEAMMLLFIGQSIPTGFLPGNPFVLSTQIFSASTVYQLMGPLLILACALVLFRLFRAGQFTLLDHGALLVGSLISARLDEAFWQTQSAPLSMDMSQAALNQQFVILAGKLPFFVVYTFLVLLLCLLLVQAICHFWNQTHPLDSLDRPLKIIHMLLVFLERTLVLATLCVPLILEISTGNLSTLITKLARLSSGSSSIGASEFLTLTLLLLLAIMGLVVLIRLFVSAGQRPGRPERFALALACISCLLLVQAPGLASLPLLNTALQFTGNPLHWPEPVLVLLFLLSLLVPPLLASGLWLRRSFFAEYRELLRLAFLCCAACALLQLVWPFFLPVSLILLLAGVLLAGRIERVG